MEKTPKAFLLSSTRQRPIHCNLAKYHNLTAGGTADPDSNPFTLGCKPPLSVLEVMLQWSNKTTPFGNKAEMQSKGHQSGTSLPLLLCFKDVVDLVPIAAVRCVKSVTRLTALRNWSPNFSISSYCQTSATKQYRLGGGLVGGDLKNNPTANTSQQTEEHFLFSQLIARCCWIKGIRQAITSIPYHCSVFHEKTRTAE